MLEKYKQFQRSRPEFLLGWREFGWDEDAAVHLTDQRNCVGDAVVPARLSPCILAGFLALSIRFVAPDVMHVVETADLREEAGVGFIVVASVVDGTCPVVSPFDHGAGLEAVRSHFVDVVTAAGLHHRPVAEGEQVLQVAGTQKSTAFCGKFHVVLEVARSARESLKRSLNSPDPFSARVQPSRPSRSRRCSARDGGTGPSRRPAPTNWPRAHKPSPFSTRSVALFSCCANKKN